MPHWGPPPARLLPGRRGRYAQLLSDSKGLTPEEEELFDASAQHAYASFRDKAAESRGMTVEAMQVGTAQQVLRNAYCTMGTAQRHCRSLPVRLAPPPPCSVRCSQVCFLQAPPRPPALKPLNCGP